MLRAGWFDPVDEAPELPDHSGSALLPLKGLVKVKYYKVNFAVSDKYPVK